MGKRFVDIDDFINYIKGNVKEDVVCDKCLGGLVESVERYRENILAGKDDISDEDVLGLIKVMIAEVEWEYPLDYAVLLERISDIVRNHSKGVWKYVYAGTTAEGRYSEYFVCSLCRYKEYGMSCLPHCPGCGAEMSAEDATEI